MNFSTSKLFAQIHKAHVKLRQQKEYENLSPQDTGDLPLNTIPLIWMLLLKYNCMAGILLTRKSLINRAKELLQQIRSAGIKITDLSQRQRLESYALYWSRFISEVTDEYHDFLLLEPEEKNKKKLLALGKPWIFAISAILVIGGAIATIYFPKKAEIKILPFDPTWVIPSGWMSDNNTPNKFITLSEHPQSDCDQRRGCYKFTYKPGGNWGGVYWFPINCGKSGREAWEKIKKRSCGINILKKGDFSQVKYLTFEAKRDTKNQENAVINFQVGSDKSQDNIPVLPQPSRSLSNGKAILSNDWTSYKINLIGLDLTKAVGLFLWGAEDADNTNEVTFYLRNIQFEGKARN